MSITIYDIGARLGVSHATVSRALRDDPTIAQATRQKVQLAAQKMGYRPNLTARSLSRGKTQLVGFLMHAYLDEAPLTKLLRLDHLAQRDHYRLLVTRTGGDPQTALVAARELVDRGVDGLLVYGLPYETPADIGRKISKLAPTVFLDDQLGFEGHHVLLDRAAGMKQAVLHMVQCGHRHLLFCRAGWITDSPVNRFAGFAAACRAHGLCVDDRIIQVAQGGHTQPLDTHELPQRLLEALHRFPQTTALCCTNDALAMAVGTALRRMQLRIPDDLSLMGFDSHWATTHCEPPLATVRQPVQAVADAAWSMLTALMSDHKVQQSPALETEFLLRPSIDAPRRKRLKLT